MQNLWDIAKSVNRRKCIDVNTFIRKEERLKNKALSIQLKKLENAEEQTHEPWRE